MSTHSPLVSSTFKTTALKTLGPLAKLNFVGKAVINLFIIISYSTPKIEFQGPTIPKSVI